MPQFLRGFFFPLNLFFLGFLRASYFSAAALLIIVLSFFFLSLFFFLLGLFV